MTPEMAKTVRPTKAQASCAMARRVPASCAKARRALVPANCAKARRALVPASCAKAKKVVVAKSGDVAHDAQAMNDDARGAHDALAKISSS